MSENHVALAADLTELEDIYAMMEIESPHGRQAAFLAFVDEQFDEEYEEDLEIEDIALEGGWVIVEFHCSDGLCHEIVQALFSGLGENGAERMAALVHDGRIGLYSLLVPGYDEAEAVDDCFDDFDGMMHDLEDVRDRREQLLHVLELMETEPVRSQLREFLGEDNAFETAEDEVDDDSDLEEFDEESDFDEEDDTLSRSELMARLNEAMAAGDEERAAELFEQVQRL
jgi:hypothetical protein